MQRRMQYACTSKDILTIISLCLYFLIKYNILNIDIACNHFIVSDGEKVNASLIAGAVVGSVIGIVILVAAGYLVYKVCFAAEATAAVGPAPPANPTVFSSQPPPTYSSSGTNTAFAGSHPVSDSIPVPPEC